MKKRKILIISILVILVIYLIPSIYLSTKVFTIARSSYKNFGENNPFPEVVSGEIYERMSYRKSHYLAVAGIDQAVEEKDFMTVPITIWWGKKANATYWYSYETYYKNGESLSGSRNVPVHITLYLVDGKWIIADFYEAP